MSSFRDATVLDDGAEVHILIDSEERACLGDATDADSVRSAVKEVFEAEDLTLAGNFQWNYGLHIELFGAFCFRIAICISFSRTI